MRAWGALGIALLLLAPESAVAKTLISLPPAVVEVKARTAGSSHLFALLTKRRSVRRFAPRALPMKSVGQLLWAAQGITDKDKGLRTAPSAGALYPLELLLVAGRVAGLRSGVYRYLPARHGLRLIKGGDLREALSRSALNQRWIATAPAVLVLSGVASRTAVKYGRRARRYVLIEAGHASQNIYLTATAMKLGTTFVGAFSDGALSQLLGLAAGEAPLGIMPLGFAP